MRKISLQATRGWNARPRTRICERIRRMVHGVVVVRLEGPRGLPYATAQVETSSHAYKRFYHEKENQGDGVVMHVGPQRI